MPVIGHHENHASTSIVDELLRGRSDSVDPLVVSDFECVEHRRERWRTRPEGESASTGRHEARSESAHPRCLQVTAHRDGELAR